MLQITPAQYVALGAVFESAQRNKNALVLMHTEIMKSCRWQTPDRIVLNKLSAADIADYCDGNFQVIERQATRILVVRPDGAKLTEEQATTIENWFSDTSNHISNTLPSRGKLMSRHYRYHGKWEDDMAPLNDVPVDTLGRALYYGYQPI